MMKSLLIAILICLAFEAQKALSEYENDTPKIEANFEDTHKILLNNHYYRIDQAGSDQTLTAEFEGKLTPEPVSLLPWQGEENQIWKADHIDEGVILTPYVNDYNEVTSFFESGATAYHIWNLGIPRSTRILTGSSSEGPFLLRNAQRKCLKGSGRIVTSADCSIMDKAQLWKFQEVVIDEDQRK